MRFTSSRDFRNWPSRSITLIGMSGAGKTTLASLLQQGGWFQYSADYRIGTRYMGEHIIDNVKREAMKLPFLASLLRADSIHITSNISFDNLSPVSTYLGKLGNPILGGLPFAEYKRRQEQFRAAEISALLDVPLFMSRARDIYGYQHFVCDSGGSTCEVVDAEAADDPVLRCLADNSLLLYIEGNAEHTRMLVERFKAQPKPMYYQPAFLEAKWAEFKALKRTDHDDDIIPDEFAVWGFEQLVHHRIPLYDAIADRYGYRIAMTALAQVESEADFLDLLSDVIGGA